MSNMEKNTEKTLREFWAPDLSVDSFCIHYPDLEADFELWTIVHLLPKFHGLSGADPNRHLYDLEMVCSSWNPLGISEEDVILRAFPFSVADSAKDWLYCLPPNSISSWTEMKKLFLARFFPASRIAAIRRSICGIQQFTRESFQDYWDRFKRLVASCPQHQISDQLLIVYFYEGLIPMDRSMVDVASGGALVNKTSTQARELIEIMVANYQQYGTRPMITEDVHSFANVFPTRTQYHQPDPQYYHTHQQDRYNLIEGFRYGNTQQGNSEWSQHYQLYLQHQPEQHFREQLQQFGQHQETQFQERTQSSTQLQLQSDQPTASTSEKMDCRVCDILDFYSASLHDFSSFLHCDVVVDPDNVVVDDIVVSDVLDVAGDIFDDGSVGEIQESLPSIILPPIEPFILLNDDGSVGETQESLPLIEPDPEPVLSPDQDNVAFTVLDPPGIFQDGKVDISSEFLGNTKEVVHFDCSGCDMSFDSCSVDFVNISNPSHTACVQELHPFFFSVQEFF
ncbi:uncharacterized protein LOC122001823 [Zingiber officinale]|uniref:uncharacterized protein LOC122001823 n=1 Tax=Zingiber officinale TaxID=94328 RepID=UPI001C4BC8CA|nr:uncharacterized protein LOC122001823 [Zingiber officinale]